MNIWVWVVIFVACLVIEGMAAGLVSIWFAAGALVAGICNLIWPDVVWLQWTAFLVVSGVSLAATRPLARRLREKKAPTNADRNIGQEAVLITGITEHETGTVKVNGLVWNAASVDSLPIEKGAAVIVREIQGSKLLVERK